MKSMKARRNKKNSQTQGMHILKKMNGDSISSLDGILTVLAILLDLTEITGSWILSRTPRWVPISIVPHPLCRQRLRSFVSLPRKSQGMSSTPASGATMVVQLMSNFGCFSRVVVPLRKSHHVVTTSRKILKQPTLSTSKLMQKPRKNIAIQDPQAMRISL
jgi:hypothetical protein